MAKLINDEYQEQLKAMHSSEKMFAAGSKKLSVVDPILKKYNPKTLLDFGCGKGGLINVIHEQYKIEVAGYDPGVDQFSNWPDRAFDVVISTDALEHIEPPLLKDTLREIDKLFTQAAFFIIACYPAKKALPDGRNAHLIIQDPDWWQEKLLECMNVRIVHQQIKHRYMTPKKGPAISGDEYIVILERP